ncbi:MAG: hypothetical protein QXI64_10465 [Sulfolobales archaeon]
MLDLAISIYGIGLGAEEVGFAYRVFPGGVEGLVVAKIVGGLIISLWGIAVSRISRRIPRYGETVRKATIYAIIAAALTLACATINNIYVIYALHYSR